MINNRQNGRRRGRGGQQARNSQPGGQDRGNRIDNRARGNAAQLLEKYKNLAGEAQRQGDRVNTEYYLQFADHYFRVLSESRARFEEQRPQRSDGGRDDGGREDFGSDGDYAEEGQRFESRGGQTENWNDGEDEGYAPQQPERRVEPPRQDERAPRNDARPEEGDRRPRRPRNPNGNGNGQYAAGANGHDREEQPDGRIEIDRLPAGFGAAIASEGEPIDAGNEEAAPRRRRAPRRPREEAPAAEV